MNVERIWQTFVARNKEFVRDRSVLGWSIFFPFLLILGFSFAFSDNGSPVYKIGYVGAEQWPAAGFEAVAQLSYLQYIQFPSQEQAIDKLEHHQIDAMINIPANELWTNNLSKESYLASQVLKSSGKDFNFKTVETATIRYVDWVCPGIIAMNLMFGSLYGLGYVLVNYRKNGVLRRFRATPIRKFEFLAAQILSRLVVVLSTTSIVLVGARLAVGNRFEGSIISLLVVIALGSLCMISVGLVVAARLRSKEFADGILNLMAWPMMMGSGVWFSLEGTAPGMQLAAKFLPLTHVVNAMRKIMIEGATLQTLQVEVGLLAGLTLLFVSVGVAIFRWD